MSYVMRGDSMGALRSTVIMKTDICGFTPKTSVLSETELSLLLNAHKRFITDVAANNEGTIVKGEGDAFWMIFPSVTRAALAAVEMHQELRLMQIGKGDDERLAIRVVITLGDVLHHNNDIFGDTVNLTARIESVTPPDEIYLSQAAWLAINKSKIHTTFVNEWMFKGLSQPNHIYKVEQTHRTRVITNQVIVVTDVGGFTQYYQSHSIADTEYLLISLENITKRACEIHGGIIRIVKGDVYSLTFCEAEHALAAMEQLCHQWELFMQHNNVTCGMRVGIYRGDMYIFRSFGYGEAGVIARLLSGLRFSGQDPISILVGQNIYDAVQRSCWEQKLHRVDIERMTIPIHWNKGLFFQKLIDNGNVYEVTRSHTPQS